MKEVAGNGEGDPQKPWGLIMTSKAARGSNTDIKGDQEVQFTDTRQARVY